MRKLYLVTALAGSHIAGYRNPGAGETLHLTERQAEHELRIGAVEGPIDQAAAKQRSRK
jgi:hypothetical protein